MTTLAVLTALLLGCDPKPLSELPGMSGKETPDERDRNIPNGSTLAAALSLLDPPAADPKELARRRAEFVQKLNTLLPAGADQERLGFTRILRWHQVYTRRLSEHQQSLLSHRQGLSRVLKPQEDNWVMTDHNGMAKRCEKPDTPIGAEEPPDQPPVCSPVMGAAGFDHQVSAISAEIPGLVEALWYLVTHIERVRRELDP